MIQPIKVKLTWKRMVDNVAEDKIQQRLEEYHLELNGSMAINESFDAVKMATFLNEFEQRINYKGDIRAHIELTHDVT